MSGSKAVTIQQVALAAGVAVSTVSRVLNGGYASAASKRRVEEAIGQLGFVPSVVARNLKLRRTGIVGVVAATSQAPWFTQLLGGLEEVLAERRVSVALGSLEPHGVYDATRVADWIRDRRVDGLVFARAGKRERPLVQAAEKAGIPMAFVVPDLRFRCGLILVADNVRAGTLAGEHLLRLGHRRFAFYGGPADSVDSKHRLQGLSGALVAEGLAMRTEHVAFERDYSSDSGVRAARHWLSLPRRAAPTAVVLGNDAMALGFLRQVQAAGCAVPGAVSVVGFDGVPETGLVWPGLTTVTQPTQEMGRDACRWLLEAILGEGAGAAEPRRYEMHLLVRESTGAPPATSR